jgi:hypothetical protein
MVFSPSCFDDCLREIEQSDSNLTVFVGVVRGCIYFTTQTNRKLVVFSITYRSATPEPHKQSFSKEISPIDKRSH